MRNLLLIFCFLFLTSSTTQSVTRYNLVVYGGTAGGVMTAVSAAREGLTVALLEPTKHLGGMVTGGLSRTDFGKKEVIGGIALEFYQRAGKKYGREIEWMPEPRVAEAILNEMIAEAKTVTVFLNHRLKEKGGVKKQGLRVTEITMENGARFQGSIFADASYEGDLLAQAGVSFT
ncbi:MAG: FAD-dependent oxidoreductase, partial [Acidobacteriota bacterium]